MDLPRGGNHVGRTLGLWSFKQAKERGVLHEVIMSVFCDERNGRRAKGERMGVCVVGVAEEEQIQWGFGMLRRSAFVPRITRNDW